MIYDKNFNIDELIVFMKNSESFFYDQLHNCGMTLEDYAKKLCQKGTISAIIGDKKIIGVIIGYTDDTLDNLSYITQVYVNSNYRGQGIAQKLLSEYITFCKIKKLNGIWLTVKKENNSAQKLYEKNGFMYDYNFENERLFKMILRF